MVTTTPIWLVLIAALGGGIFGALISGILLILNNHLQAKRDNDRQQRDYQMATRIEILSRVKHAVDLGAAVTFELDRISEGAEITDYCLTVIREFGRALNGALVSAIAIGEHQLRSELLELSSSMEQIVLTIKDGTFKNVLLGEVIDKLAAIESRYVTLRLHISDP